MSRQKKEARQARRVEARSAAQSSALDAYYSDAADPLLMFRTIQALSERGAITLESMVREHMRWALYFAYTVWALILGGMAYLAVSLVGWTGLALVAVTGYLALVGAIVIWVFWKDREVIRRFPRTYASRSTVVLRALATGRKLRWAGATYMPIHSPLRTAKYRMLFFVFRRFGRAVYYVKVALASYAVVMFTIPRAMVYGPEQPPQPAAAG